MTTTEFREEKLLQTRKMTTGALRRFDAQRGKNARLQFDDNDALSHFGGCRAVTGRGGAVGIGISIRLLFLLSLLLDVSATVLAVVVVVLLRAALAESLRLDVNAAALGLFLAEALVVDRVVGPFDGLGVLLLVVVQIKVHGGLRCA